VKSESPWSLLAKLILWMEEASSRTSEDRLANAAAVVVARKARIFIEEHYHTPIRMKDLCAFSGVGLRTLQRIFSSHFQVSPTGYINARRMNTVRRDLVTADPSSQTVTNIAMRNGFTHLDRFSVNYRMHFGESPRQTLTTKKARHHEHARMQFPFKSC
jgi:AraC-like DNA-binding protein